MLSTEQVTFIRQQLATSHLDSVHKELVLDYLADCCRTDQIAHAENIIAFLMQTPVAVVYAQPGSEEHMTERVTIKARDSLQQQTVQYCISCKVIEATETLCDGCLDNLLQWMAIEFDAMVYDEQVLIEGGLY